MIAQKDSSSSSHEIGTQVRIKQGNVNLGLCPGQNKHPVYPERKDFRCGEPVQDYIARK